MPTYNSVISRTDVSALIPEDVAGSVIQNAVSESAALSLFRRVTMSAAQQRMPVVSALPIAYFVSGDTGLKQTTEQNWANKYLNVEELAAIVPIPEAVLEDTSFDVWGEIQPRLAEAIGRTLDAAVFFGTNKPASWDADVKTLAAGASNTVTQGTNAAAAGGLLGDFSDLFGKIEADGFDPNGVVSHISTKGLLRQARATTGESLAGGVGPVPDVWGVDPVYAMRGLWPAQTTGNVKAFVGDFSYAILGVRRDITYKLLDQAVITDNTSAIIYNLPQQDMVAMRVTFRCAYATANPLNFDQPTEASRSPFGTLLAA